MKLERIGILHPGEMGISIAASAQNSGHQVYWVSEGRASATHDRARKFGLRDAGTVERLCTECPIIVCVCPPHAAETVAKNVLDCGFQGVYVDANAISPERAQRIGRSMSEAGISFVDGGIIGEPAWNPGKTRLYVSGIRASYVAGLFTAGPLETDVLGEAIGRASALKMCYAAYSKGSTALLCAVLATAQRLGVREPLFKQWAQDDAGFPEQASQRVRRVTAKAWRFAGEMEEISSTFADAGLPGDFHHAAAIIYRSLARFKDSKATPDLALVLDALLQTESEPAG